MKPVASAEDLRCFCLRKPLLAKYGLTADAELYIHVKVWKQREIISEVFITRGIVSLRCRECRRWHRVKIRDATARLEELLAPPTEIHAV